MSSPDPLLSSAQIGNTVVSLANPQLPGAPPSCVGLPGGPAANDDLTLAPVAVTAALPATALPAHRIPVAIWVSLAFWMLGTAVLFTLGLAYQWFA